MTILFTYGTYFGNHLFATLSHKRHNVTALLVNMVFSDKDKILIKNSYQLKGYNVRQLRREFPDKGWTTTSLNRLLKKFRDMGTVDRR